MINGLESLFSCDVMEKVLEILILKTMYMVELNLKPIISVTTKHLMWNSALLKFARQKVLQNFCRKKIYLVVSILKGNLLNMNQAFNQTFKKFG